MLSVKTSTEEAEPVSLIVAMFKGRVDCELSQVLRSAEQERHVTRTQAHQTAMRATLAGV